MRKLIHHVCHAHVLLITTCGVAAACRLYTQEIVPCLVMGFAFAYASFHPSCRLEQKQWFDIIITCIFVAVVTFQPGSLEASYWEIYEQAVGRSTNCAFNEYTRSVGDHCRTTSPDSVMIMACATVSNYDTSFRKCNGEVGYVWMTVSKVELLYTVRVLTIWWPLLDGPYRFFQGIKIFVSDPLQSVRTVVSFVLLGLAGVGACRSALPCLPSIVTILFTETGAFILNKVFKVLGAFLVFILAWSAAASLAAWTWHAGIVLMELGLFFCICHSLNYSLLPLVDTTPNTRQKVQEKGDQVGFEGPVVDMLFARMCLVIGISCVYPLSCMPILVLFKFNFAYFKQKEIPKPRIIVPVNVPANLPANLPVVHAVRAVRAVRA